MRSGIKIMDHEKIAGERVGKEEQWVWNAKDTPLLVDNEKAKKKL